MVHPSVVWIQTLSPPPCVLFRDELAGGEEDADDLLSDNTSQLSLGDGVDDALCSARVYHQLVHDVLRLGPLPADVARLIRCSAFLRRSPSVVFHNDWATGVPTFRETLLKARACLNPKVLCQFSLFSLAFNLMQGQNEPGGGNAERSSVASVDSRLFSSCRFWTWAPRLVFFLFVCAYTMSVAYLVGRASPCLAGVLRSSSEMDRFCLGL